MRRLVLAAAVFSFCAPSAGNDLTDFKAMFEGRYDNDMQVFFETDRVKPGAAVRDSRHVVIRKTTDTEFSVQVMSMEFADHPLEEDWAVSASGGTVRTKITGFSEHSAVNCVATWVRDGVGFKIARAKDCASSIAKTGARLSPDGLETGARPDGLPPDQFKRIRPFECWVAVLRGAKHGDSGKGAKDSDWFFKRGVWIHDQGGTATIATDENPPREIRLRLRRVAWPSGPNRPSLTLYVMEPGDDRAVSYSWAEYNAGRLGLNLRWMQASCTYAPEKLWP